MRDLWVKLSAMLLFVALAFAAVALFVHLRRLGTEVPTADRPPAVMEPVVPAEPEPVPLPEVAAEPSPEDDPMAALRNTGVVTGDADPRALVERIGRALENGDVESVERLLGEGVLSAAQREQLGRLAAGGRLRLREGGPVREVGELDAGQLGRWVLEFERQGEGLADAGGRIFFDLRRKDDKWVVERVTMPEAGEGPPRAVLADSLGIADLFVQAVLRQEFELAHEFVDTAQVSDAKIAALCILFEEANYRLREHKPLRQLFERGGTAGFLANVDAVDGSHAAQFGLTLRLPDDGRPWQVTEINLDTMLDDYARRVAGGDVYYTPLVPNPQGGDKLVLYFEFDEDGLNPRTERQLQIVARILRSDGNRKIHITGHTDALGTEDYNQRLSARRAETVREYLVQAGVAAGQIVTSAMGTAKPRRPNVLEDGTDNPLGRRANRRSEIYLDF